MGCPSRGSVKIMGQIGLIWEQRKRLLDQNRPIGSHHKDRECEYIHILITTYENQIVWLKMKYLQSEILHLLQRVQMNRTEYLPS